jgi:hypothetical protein
MRSPEDRGRAARVLWHTTDLLIAGRYSEDEIWTFGEVIERLAEEIELASGSRLAKRLASSNNAPIDDRAEFN